MKNYSDIKSKPQYATTTYRNTDVTMTVSSEQVATKPLIHPASATQASPQIKSKAAPTKSSAPRPAFNWDDIINRTFLSLYVQKDDPLVGVGKYDYAFHIGAQRLYIVVHHESMDVNTLQLAQNRITALKQRAATKLSKRFQQIRQKMVVAQQEEEEVATAEYCVGLTALSVYFEDQEYPIEHDYSSQFFQEECVLDLDDNSQTLQLFSLGGMLSIIKLLQTPSDLLTFLDYHRPILVNQLPYANEVTLAQTFLTSPKFFERAIKVQKQLVNIGLLATIEERLMDATKSQQNAKLLDKKSEEADSTQQAELIQKLQNYAIMYQKLINGLAKRQHDLGQTLPVHQVQLLVNESMYTRMSIIEEVVAYADRSEAECRSGYLCHQHSYNHFGHHYVLIVYGIDKDAQYSREAVKNNYENLLMDINSQLQKPVMKEYFILGFDMSKHDGEGNITVELDAYHQAGSTMTMMERRLYERVQALSSL